MYQGGVALERIGAPTLVLAGAADPLAVRPETLAQAIPQARLQIVSGDHMGRALTLSSQSRSSPSSPKMGAAGERSSRSLAAGLAGARSTRWWEAGR